MEGCNAPDPFDTWPLWKFAANEFWRHAAASSWKAAMRPIRLTPGHCGSLQKLAGMLGILGHAHYRMLDDVIDSSSFFRMLCKSIDFLCAHATKFKAWSVNGR